MPLSDLNEQDRGTLRMMFRMTRNTLRERMADEEDARVVDTLEKKLSRVQFLQERLHIRD